MLENSILLPTNPYAATKAAAEMLLYSYGKSFTVKLSRTEKDQIHPWTSP